MIISHIHGNQSLQNLMSAQEKSSLPVSSFAAVCSCSTTSSGSVKLDVETSPSLPKSGLPEACDMEALLCAKTPILGLSTCCDRDGDRGTASAAPAACLTKALNPLGLEGLRRESAGACVGASSGAAPDSRPEVLLKDSPELSAISDSSLRQASKDKWRCQLTDKAWSQFSLPRPSAARR